MGASQAQSCRRDARPSLRAALRGRIARFIHKLGAVPSRMEAITCHSRKVDVSQHGRLDLVSQSSAGRCESNADAPTGLLRTNDSTCSLSNDALACGGSDRTSLRVFRSL
jgi:hypothetical protein